MSGVDKIIEMIAEKSAEREKEILAEAEEDREIRLEVARKRAKEQSSEIMNKAQAELKAELERFEASTRLKAKHNLLETKEALIKEVLDSALEAVGKRVGSAKYEQDLTRLVVDGAKSLEVSNLELIFPEGQKISLTGAAAAKAISSATEQKVTVKVVKETVRSSAGVIVRTEDGQRWVDNTIEARLERLDNEIRNTTVNTLFGDSKE
ncbi:MAG: V-type ATP synthase subunit E family protein [Candidatus Thorarchaeota archaeon]